VRALVDLLAAVKGTIVVALRRSRASTQAICVVGALGAVAVVGGVLLVTDAVGRDPDGLWPAEPEQAGPDAGGDDGTSTTGDAGAGSSSVARTDAVASGREAERGTDPRSGGAGAVGPSGAGTATSGPETTRSGAGATSSTTSDDQVQPDGTTSTSAPTGPTDTSTPTNPSTPTTTPSADGDDGLLGGLFDLLGVG
jgi:hypothetical protein